MSVETRKPNPLVDAFEEDHRHLTRGLHQLLATVRQGDAARARELAEEVDRVVGAHIDFEERVFYPQLLEHLGRDYVERLYHEHDAGKEALRTLLSAPAGSLAPVALEKVASDLEIALEHALSCGTLLSHLDGLPQDRLERMAEKLEEARELGRRWTELS